MTTNDTSKRIAPEARSKRRYSLEQDAERQIAEEEVARQEELARVYRVSEHLLREKKFHTFGAQLLQAVEAAERSDTDLPRSDMRRQYRYILVDEFLGHERRSAQILLWLLAGEHHGNIMAVGDHNQAIYRFPQRFVRKLHCLFETILRR